VAMVGVFFVILSMIAVMSVMVYVRTPTLLSSSSSSSSDNSKAPVKRMSMKSARSLLEEISNTEADKTAAVASPPVVADAVVASPVLTDASAVTQANPAASANPVAVPAAAAPETQKPTTSNDAAPAAVAANNNAAPADELPSFYIENEMATTTPGSPSYG